MSKRTNEQWLTDLQTSGAIRDDALADLREIIIAGLPYALSKWLSTGDPKFEALIEEAAQDTLLRVLDKLDTFEGRSQFTTWVHKIAVRMALTELRRRKWRDVSLEGLTITVFPLTIAAKVIPARIARGKFQGGMMTPTPNGIYVK